MDLNLLDSCIGHFIDGFQPDLTSDNVCSLENNLNHLLDQDGNRVFNIFDVDLCIRNFLDAEACSGGLCPDGGVYCATDSACGSGLYCNLKLNRCERECGLVGSREEGTAATLERKCSRALTACDYGRGRCTPLAKLDETTCQADSDCPVGALCSLGRCTAKCRRSTDCPDSTWYCGTENRCLPRPSVAPDPSFVFDPRAYSVMFGARTATLTAVESSAHVPLLIMDRASKKQVFNNGAVLFGYRVEVVYDLKQDTKCLKNPLPPADQDDCYVGPSKQFVRLGNPFGTVSASERPGLDVSLDEVNAAKLSTGLYQATVNIFFSNGGQDSFTLQYRKTSPSGEYSGRLSVYALRPENLLGNTNLTARLFVHKGQTKRWDAMLVEQGIEPDGDIRDLTEGDFVNGYIDGSASMVFDLPASVGSSDNKIPIRGIYSPKYGRMRLIASVDTPADFCRSDSGACKAGPPGAEETRVTNPFGRPIRQVMHFIGPFDERTYRFHGLYREVLYGLAPTAITLEGGFQLDQWRNDDTALCDKAPAGWTGSDPCYVAPIYPAVVSPVVFPSDAVVKRNPNGSVAGLVHDDVVKYCSTSLAAFEGMFTDPVAFQAYLGGFCVNRGTDGTCSDYCSDTDSDGKCDGDTTRAARVLTQMLRLEGRVGEALKSLCADKNEDGVCDTPAATSSMLTLTDFLRGQIVFCDASVTTNCINEKDALCGIALHRSAILSGAVPLEYEPRYLTKAGTSEPILESLFCGGGDAAHTTPSCRLDGATFPTTVTLQEHNRFFMELAQATRYQAANDLSDAFVAMYRAANNDLDRAKVFGYKRAKLHSALGQFSNLIDQMFSPEATALLFAWPMAGFESNGGLWLNQMHSVLKDRLETVSGLVDLKRRAVAATGDADFSYLQHLMHFEYLTQAFLITLQHTWQGDQFAYAGQGPAALETGQDIVSRVTSGRNPLGLHPSQIFFENANLSTSNWKNYRNQILSGPPGAGLLNDVDAAVSAALTNLKGSLTDTNTLIAQIQSAGQQFEQELDGLCGAPDAVPAGESGCELVSDEARQAALACEGSNCGANYQCDDPACSTVVRLFTAATGENLRGSACDVKADKIVIRDGTGTRLCMRGQMGTALRDREQQRLQRDQILRKVRVLLKQVEAQAKYIDETMAQDVGLVAFVGAQAAAMTQVEGAIGAADSALRLAETTAAGFDCIVIAGTANGTDCPSKAAGVAVRFAAITEHAVAVGPLNALRTALAISKELAMLGASQQTELRRERMVLDNLITQVENYSAEYETLTATISSTNARIDDIRYLAEQAVRRHRETVGTLIDHLIGSQNGDVLLRNKYVQAASTKFDDLLLATYKLTMAFIHSYNLKAQSEQLVNRVFQLMTPDDVREYLADLDRYEANYCGGAGLDCDSVNNVEHFRYSIRDQLFPNLRDIVDGRTGAVLTKGQQFHNIITSDTFVRTRQRAGRLVRQIEIPFSIWLNDRGSKGAYGQRWMVSPLECNHIIAPGAGGTMAVNVLGTRLRNLTYELWRGNTDYIRSCDPVENVSRDGAVTTDYPINTLIVGYAPQNTLAQKENPPSYLTHSNGLLACKNVPELRGNFITNETCYKYFARERSLGAPDYIISIPFEVGYANEWIFGPDEPVIEDIVLYIRYRTRPI